MRVTQPRFTTLLPDPAADASRFLRNVCARIDEYARDVRIVVRLAVKEEHAGLRGDRDTHLVSQHEAATPLEVFFREKNLDVTVELFLVGS